MGQQQSLACEIEIEAPPALVREIFMDFPRYKEWHPEWEITLPDTVAQPSQLREGDRIKIKMPGFGFSGVITKNNSEALQWLGSVPFIFTGAHGFDFAPSSKTPGGTRFVQLEEFSGLAAFMMAPGWSFRDSTQAGWTAFNESLKREAEKQAKARAAA